MQSGARTSDGSRRRPSFVDSTSEITDLLLQVRHGHRDAMDRLFAVVYDELRRIAHRQLGRDRPDGTLGTTALVHEAYMKLVDHSRAEWRDRGHFFGVAARAMRQILVDHARKYQTFKRGRHWRRVPLDAAIGTREDQADAVVELEEALTKLAALDRRLVQVVECRFFAGLTEEETAEAMGVTARTVRRFWVKAKGLLYVDLVGSD